MMSYDEIHDLQTMMEATRRARRARARRDQVQLMVLSVQRVRRRMSGSRSWLP